MVRKQTVAERESDHLLSMAVATDKAASRQLMLKEEHVR